MNMTDSEQQKIRTRLTELRLELDKLKAQAAREKADKRVEFDQYLDSLHEKSKEVGAKLDALKDSGGDALDDIRTGLNEAWERLAIAKRAAKARFH